MKIFRAIPAALCAVALSLAPAAADAPAPFGAAKRAVRCSVCGGSGRLALRPPDYGQHSGAIEHKGHWDEKIACPVCGGAGRTSMWRREVRQPRENAPEPCPACGWDGVSKCRKCLGTGTVQCRRTGCKNGWIVTEKRSASRAKKAPDVAPCPECKGLGKAKCAECDGAGGVLCRKCHGKGCAEEKRK